MSARGALRSIIFCALATATAPAVAASFGLSPVGLTISATEMSGSVVVTNTGVEPVVVQARSLAWSQNGAESRSETRELIVNPPIFKIAPGEQQLVRVASRSAPHVDTERAYRVIFTEVATAAEAKPGFRITLAMDIPVYVAPVRPGAPQIDWRFERNSIFVENSGGRHYRLREVRVLNGDQAVHTLPRIVVLAKSRLAIDLPESVRPAGGLRLIGQDDADQPVTIDVPLARPK